MLCILHANNILYGYIIQSVDMLYRLFIPVNWIISYHFQSVRWICYWGLLLADSSWDCTEPHGVLSPVCCLPGAEHTAGGVGNHSLELFSGPASWQEGPNEASPTPGSWKSRRRPEDLALMSSGSSREGSLKVQESLWLFWVSLGLREEPLFEPQHTNLCWSFIIYRCQTQQLQAAFCIWRSSIVLAMFLTGCNFLNWIVKILILPIFMVLVCSVIT